MNIRKHALPLVSEARLAAGIFVETDDLPISYFQRGNSMHATQPITACIVDNLIALSQPEDELFYPAGAKIDGTQPIQLRSVYFRMADGSAICVNVLLPLEHSSHPDRAGKVVIGNKHHEVSDKKIYVGAVLWLESGHLTFQVHEKPDDWEYLGYTLRYNICSAEGEPLV